MRRETNNRTENKIEESQLAGGKPIGYIKEGLNGIYRQPSNGLKLNSVSKMQSDFNRQNASGYLKTIPIFYFQCRSLLAWLPSLVPYWPPLLLSP